MTSARTVPATLRWKVEAALGQVLVGLEVPEDVLALHQRPGQFIELFLDEPAGTAQGYFALLNAPGEGDLLTLLVRTDAPVGGEAARLLVDLAPGTVLRTSPPLGAGFPLERAVNKTMRVATTGTALAPARAAMRVLLESGAEVASLDHGVRSEAHIALSDDLAQLRARGVDVAIHLSQLGPGGLTGRLVQDALEARWDGEAARKEVVLVVGQPELVVEVRRRWEARGGDPADVLTNV